MESISQLREICQKPRLWADTWQGRYICRPVSIYITSLFLRMGFSPDAATFSFLACGILGSLLLISSNRVAFFAGTLFLQLSYILDHVDGEIARYRKQTSLTGIYLDKISHYILHPFIFLCMGLSIYNYRHDFMLFMASLLAGYSILMISISTDAISSVLNDNEKPIQSINQSAGSLKSTKNSNDERKNLFARVFSMVHALCVFPTVMNIIFFASLLNLFIDFNIIEVLVIFYAACATFVWMARVLVFILQKRVDKEGVARHE